MGSRINFHLYTDGSAFQDTNKYGIGWVRTDHKDRRPSCFSKRLKLQRASSLIAELYAVSRALDHTRKNSKIHLHTDCADICAAIAEKKIAERIQRARKTKPLKEAWEAVDRAIQRHTEVTVQFTSSSKEHPNPYMDIAHHLAQLGALKSFNKAASGASNRKRRRDKDIAEGMEPS